MSQRTDADRLDALRQLLILDTQPERDFDRVTEMLAESLQAPIAMINMLDENRDWFKSCVGLSQTESPAATSFCAAFFATTDPIIIVEDTFKDALLSTHPLVVAPPHIRFYAAARLQVAGQTIGTLCAYDVQPHTVDVEQVRNLQVLASAVVELLVKRSNGLSSESH